MLKPSNGSHFGDYEVSVEKEIKIIRRVLERIEYLQLIHAQPLVLEGLQIVRAFLVKDVRANDALELSDDELEDKATGNYRVNPKEKETTTGKA